jgi:hypothetical protein
MSTDSHDLIPPPGVVRERLARNYEDADLLRRLLKLSVAAAEQKRQRGTQPRQHQQAVGREDGR